LWLASFISNLGDGVTTAAAPLLAAHLTSDPRLVAGLAVAQRLPWLVFALVAGALVDRWDRRRVMINANVFRAFALGLVAVLAATDTIGLVALYTIFLAVGIAETFFDNAAQAYMPRLVESTAQLPAANSRLYAGEILANQFAGPPIGGIVFGVALALPFALDGASFAAAAVLIATIGIANAPAPVTAGRVRHCGATSAKACATSSTTGCCDRWPSYSA
jgi:MFS family permease